MNKNSVIQVFFEKQLVGQLTMHGHNTAFEYDMENTQPQLMEMDAIQGKRSLFA